MALPLRLLRPLQTLRRDLGAATAMLRGQAPAPFADRDGGAWPPVRAPRSGRSLRVTAVDRLTDDAVRLRLQPEDSQPLPFRAGQFLVVSVDGPDGPARRAYSLCSDPRDPTGVAVAVKAVANGRVSPQLVHQTVVGDLLSVSGPSGAFGHPLSPGQARLHVLVAGGSGITPMVALLHDILATEPGSRAVLVVGNVRKRDRMLVDDLDALVTRYGPRLVVRDVLERPPPGWKAGRGRLDGPGLAAQLDALELAVAPSQCWYLCGPGGMLDACERWLLDAGLAPDQLAIERFTSGTPDAEPASFPATACPVTLRGRRGERTFSVAPGQTILTAARDAGVALPFSCTLGGCGACTQTLVSGQVHLPAPHCLSQAEQAAGAVLTCIGRPLGPVVLALREPT
ncbi:MAG: iron-sulfur cluster-binding domain-containing protein [Alphaproteobacteria bacterium]|nr:iron-sulfur cluster-binding domain-containing protein [Alphaproteobacteria bacterium]